MKTTSDEVIKSYLLWELFKQLEYSIPMLQLKDLVDTFSEEKKLKLLEAFAGPINITGLYSELTTNYDWNLTSVPTESIFLSKLYPSANLILENHNFNLSNAIHDIETNSHTFFSTVSYLEHVELQPPIALKKDS